MLKTILNSFACLVILILLAQPSKAQHPYISIPNSDVNLYYEDEGKGRTIIFIPGWTMTTGFFQKQQEYFKENYRVISYDPRSQGKSSKSIKNNTYAQHAIDLKALIDALGVSEIILVGWSSGCLTQYAYMEQFGMEKIDRMVFIDEPPKWIGDVSKEWVYGSFDGYRSSVEGLLGDRLPGAGGTVDWMLKEPIDSLERNWMISEMLMTPSYAALSLYVDGMISDYTEVLKSADGNTPMLFLLRESWIEEGKKWLSQHVPTAKALPITSHAMFWEKPAEFNRLLEQFIRSK